MFAAEKRHTPGKCLENRDCAPNKPCSGNPHCSRTTPTRRNLLWHKRAIAAKDISCPAMKSHAPVAGANALGSGSSSSFLMNLRDPSRIGRPASVQSYRKKTPTGLSSSSFRSQFPLWSATFARHSWPSSSSTPVAIASWEWLQLPISKNDIRFCMTGKTCTSIKHQANKNCHVLTKTMYFDTSPSRKTLRTQQ